MLLYAIQFENHIDRLEGIYIRSGRGQGLHILALWQRCARGTIPHAQLRSMGRPWKELRRRGYRSGAHVKNSASAALRNFARAWKEFCRRNCAQYEARPWKQFRASAD